MYSLLPIIVLSSTISKVSRLARQGVMYQLTKFTLNGSTENELSKRVSTTDDAGNSTRLTEHSPKKTQVACNKAEHKGEKRECADAGDEVRIKTAVLYRISPPTTEDRPLHPKRQETTDWKTMPGGGVLAPNPVSPEGKLFTRLRACFVCQSASPFLTKVACFWALKGPLTTSNCSTWKRPLFILGTE